MESAEKPKNAPLTELGKYINNVPNPVLEVLQITDGSQDYFPGQAPAEVVEKRKETVEVIEKGLHEHGINLVVKDIHTFNELYHCPDCQREIVCDTIEFAYVKDPREIKIILDKRGDPKVEAHEAQLFEMSTLQIHFLEQHGIATDADGSSNNPKDNERQIRRFFTQSKKPRQVA